MEAPSTRMRCQLPEDKTPTELPIYRPDSEPTIGVKVLTAA
jgi:hypothetical protein